MPQAPSPNMGIIWPTDLSDADVWAPIMDTAVRAVIDSHDHSTGKGVRIPAAALNINADVSWSDALGGSHSITDLVSVDFKPSPAASVTALAGAFFISDGTGGLSANELYFRTIAGTDVKFTAGAALNVVAFTGGIGGDYSAVGALEVFDDATDSYWFQQQVGAAVRQYARMRSADVDLYEFKANPAAGVPTNRVRLASPAALAGSYAITMPAALPAATDLVSMTAAGVLAADGKHGDRVLQMPGVSGVVGTGTASYDTSGNLTTTAAAQLIVALPLRQGDRIKVVTFARFGDGAVDATNVTVDKITSAAVQTSIGSTTITNAAAAWTDTTIDVTDTVFAAGDVMILTLVLNAANFKLNNIRVTYDRP